MNTEVTIIIKNNNSKIKGDTSIAIGAISMALSVKVPNYWFSKKFKMGLWDGSIKFLKRPENTFPTGLLPKVIEVLNDMQIPFKLKDERHKICVELPSKFCLNGKVLRDYQDASCRAALTHEIEKIPFYRGIINIATNGGKTTIAGAVIQQLYDQVKSNSGTFLFVTHSKEIAAQAKKSLEHDLGIEVGMIGDGKWEVSTVTVALIGTLYSKQKSKDTQYDELKEKTLGFIVDECHHSPADSFYSVLHDLPNAYIRLGLTGTVDKLNPVNDMKLAACTGEILIKISNDFLIENGFSAKPTCYFVDIEGENIDNMPYQEAYSHSIVNNEERNEVITQICVDEAEKGNTSLVLVERVDHGNNIYRLLQNTEVKVAFTHGSLSSVERQDLLQELANGKIDVLISTSILDEGVDVSNINTVIYARGMKSSRKLLQGIGRGLRKKEISNELKFYDFIDQAHVTLLEHTAQRLDTLIDEGFDIVRL